MLSIGPGCSTGLFEMADSLYQFSNVYAARSLVQPQRGEIPVRLVNPSMQVVTLEPKTRIGKVTSTTGVGSTTLISQDNSSVVSNRGGSSTFSDILKGSKYKTTPKDHTQTIIIVLIIMPERSRTIEISKALYLQNQN